MPRLVVISRLAHSRALVAITWRSCIFSPKRRIALTGCYTPGFSFSPATDASDLSQAALPGGCDGLRLPGVLRAHGTAAQPGGSAHQSPVRFRKHAAEAREGMVARLSGRG